MDDHVRHLISRIKRYLDFLILIVAIFSFPAIINEQIVRMPRYHRSRELPEPDTIPGATWLQSTRYQNIAGFNTNDEIKTIYMKSFQPDLTDEDVVGSYRIRHRLSFINSFSLNFGYPEEK